MYISTEIHSFQAYGDNDKILAMLKEAGFDAYDYSMFHQSHAYREVLCADDYIEQAKALRAYADGLGIVCNQAHAPFISGRMGIEAYNEEFISVVRRAIEVAAILGAKIIVVHPWNNYTAQENAKMYGLYEETARKAGIKIGVENMWNWKSGEPTACAAACSHHDDFKAHLDLLPSDVFVACVDIGHAEMAGLDTNAPQMLETLGERVEALHIHDNDLIHDSHLLPFAGKINFNAMIEALKEIGYQGDITMEAAYYANKFPVELYPQAARLMAETAEYFRKALKK
ncbi:MAG: sugar phosphate isomerase/epimerase [Clostridia bacterium]|nr:sugar phosphate isomerase/epimerase [Clostridia bacterium]